MLNETGSLQQAADARLTQCRRQRPGRSTPPRNSKEATTSEGRGHHSALSRAGPSRCRAPIGVQHYEYPGPRSRCGPRPCTGSGDHAPGARPAAARHGRSARSPRLRREAVDVLHLRPVRAHGRDNSRGRPRRGIGRGDGGATVRGPRPDRRAAQRRSDRCADRLPVAIGGSAVQSGSRCAA